MASIWEQIKATPQYLGQVFGGSSQPTQTLSSTPSFSNFGTATQASTQQNLSGTPFQSSPGYSKNFGTGSVLGTSNTFNPTPAPQQPMDIGQNPNQGAADAAQAQAQAELNAALTEFDRAAEEARIQKSSAETQKGLAVGDIEAQTEKAKTRAGTLTEEAASSRKKETETALSTSQDTIRKNRNILRALGILSSSAAGEMLARPTEEFQKVSNDLKVAFEKRKGEVDQWLSERLDESDRAIRQVDAQFNDIVARIDSDLRFNQRDKIDAVRQAQSALQGRIAELQAQAQSYAQAAQQYNNDMMMQMAQLQLYQNPSANVQGILSSLITTPQQYQPIQVGTLSTERKDIYK